MYFCGCGHTQQRDDGRDDGELSVDAECAYEGECKPHGERHAVQRFTLCDNSQNCQNHQSVGISVTVLSLVRCNLKGMI